MFLLLTLLELPNGVCGISGMTEEGGANKHAFFLPLDVLLLTVVTANVLQIDVDNKDSKQLGASKGYLEFKCRKRRS